MRTPPLTTDTVETAHKPKRRKLFIGAAAGLALLLAGGGVAVASAHKSVEIDIDGEIQSIGTFAGSVSGALETLGFEPARYDKVNPRPVDKLEDGANIVVRTAHRVEFDKEDGATVELWTIGRTAGDALADVAERSRDLEFQVSRASDGRPELALPLVTDGDVIFKVDGEEITESFTGTVTLDEALEELSIELADLDETVVKADADGTPVVTITRIVVEEKKTTKTVEFKDETRTNSEKYKDQKQVVQQGKDGERTIVTKITKVDGEVTEKEEISNEVTTKPVTHIVEVGTKTRPAPKPAPKPAAPSSSSGSSSSSSSSSSGGGGGKAPTSGVWAALAQCESGGNPSIVSASGTYHGLYQFSVATWQSVGGSGLPSQASAAEQTKRAQMLQARSGWGQWPACSQKIGVR